jgi:outer membrane lipoprotein-sorting protein
MKKLLLVFAAIAIAAGVCAQKDSTKMKMSPRDMKSIQNDTVQKIPFDKSYPDGVIMLNAQMMLVKNAKLSILDHEMTMSDGTRVMCDGNYIKNDGTKLMLKEGQHIDMFGNIILFKAPNDRNLFVVPDSIMKRE